MSAFLLNSALAIHSLLDRSQSCRQSSPRRRQQMPALVQMTCSLNLLSFACHRRDVRKIETASASRHVRPRHHNRLLALWANVKQLNGMHGTCRHPCQPMYGEHDPIVYNTQRANAFARPNKQMPGLDHMMTNRVPERGSTRPSAGFNWTHHSHGALSNAANTRQFCNLG
nr:hypothetical protein [Burkholderia pseudomallei]